MLEKTQKLRENSKHQNYLINWESLKMSLTVTLSRPFQMDTAITPSLGILNEHSNTRVVLGNSLERDWQTYCLSYILQTYFIHPLLFLGHFDIKLIVKFKP